MLLAIIFINNWPPSKPVPQQPVMDCSPSNPCLAIVIDDIGRDLAQLKRLVDLPFELTFSVLPHARYTAESVTMIRERRRELMLHLPMAPLDRSKITDESVVLNSGTSIVKSLQACLQQIPDAQGVNNHMGSALSQDTAALRQIFPWIRARGLWFLDSRTIDKSVICSAAHLHGVLCRERDFFLDDPPVASKITLQWGSALKLARQRGWAIVIGHPLSITIDTLEKILRQPTLTIRVKRLSSLFKLGTQTNLVRSRRKINL